MLQISCVSEIILPEMKKKWELLLCHTNDMFLGFILASIFIFWLKTTTNEIQLYVEPFESHFFYNDNIPKHRIEDRLN